MPIRTAAIAKTVGETFITMCRSYDVGSKDAAQLLILREILLRLHELNIAEVNIVATGRKWCFLLSDSAGIKVHWTLMLAMHDIKG